MYSQMTNILFRSIVSIWSLNLNVFIIAFYTGGKFYLLLTFFGCSNRDDFARILNSA